VYDIWYQVSGVESFGEWKLWVPVPKTPEQVGKAVETILAKHEPILITVSKSSETEL
jgi:hypothetical protein